jgi:uncharacterized SAM-binding protein YcdF (DUF218 family)
MLGGNARREPVLSSDMVVTLLLSKILPIFVYPLSVAIVLGLIALARTRRVGRVALALAVVVLWVSSMPVTASWLLGRLEDKYPAVAIDALPIADVAIVLGGSIGQPLPPRITSDLSDAADRVLEAARLFRAGKVSRILVSGGNLPWQTAVQPDAELVVDLLVEFGVPRDSIVADTESRNTRENAINSAAIMKGRGWQTALLVTSAAHMPRALAAFKRAGIDVTPATTDVQVLYPLYDSAFDFLPDAGALARTTDAIREWIGLIVYRLRGWA